MVVKAAAPMLYAFAFLIAKCKNERYNVVISRKDGVFVKKCIILFLTIMLVFSMVACAADAPADNNSDQPTVSEPTEENMEDKMLNILFLGNSLIYYNDMPSLFTRIALANGKKVNVRSVTKGSATISDFADETTEVGAKAIPLLKSQKWDIVIIEPSRRITPYENTVREAELASAKKIQELAHAAGGEVLLYSVWGNNTGTLAQYTATTPTSMSKGAVHRIDRKAHTQFMHEVNQEFAAALGGVKVALAGYAFENCIAEYDYNLYDSDKVHPSPIGSYLAAAVIYATIYEAPVGEIPYSIEAAPKTGELESIANATMLEGLVPGSAEETDDQAFNLLVVGSNLMDDYACADVFAKLVKQAEGKTVTSSYVTSSTFVINNLVKEGSDLGLCAALAEKEWDAIVVQISRRCTKSAADVEASELEALRTVMPLLKSETDKIYLFTLNSSANPAIFTTANADPGYTKTSKKESYSAVEGSAYFKSIADQWGDELSVGVINYGEAYLECSDTGNRALGYLQACMLYNTVFAKALPDSVTEINGNSTDLAKALRELAEAYCLKK